MILNRLELYVLFLPCNNYTVDVLDFTVVLY